LKSGKASLIRTIYRNERVVNAMLPFCGRCDFHITSAASHFIRQTPDPDCIKKIYLPLSQAGASQKVQVVACARPSAAVDYIKKFIEDHQDAIDKRRRELASGASKDAYLLILSPSRDVNFYKLDDARDELFRLVARYRDERRQFSDEYYKVLSYYSLAKYSLNNFTCRKVLFYEGISGNDLLTLLTACLSEEKSLSEIDSEHVNNALAKAKAVQEILDSAKSATEKVRALAECIQIRDVKSLQRDMEKAAIDSERVEATERQHEEEAELEEIAVKQMSALELLTIVGSKGLSADHVIIIGFDNVNMSRVTRNAFFVAKTRARFSLHLIMTLKAGGATHPPAFLDHLPDGNVEFSKYMKGERKLVGLRDRNEFLTYLKGLNVLGARRR
jgi:superfamily I DNA/RNA helicase